MVTTTSGARVACPHCRSKLSLPQGSKAARFRCPRCDESSPVKVGAALRRNLDEEKRESDQRTLLIRVAVAVLGLLLLIGGVYWSWPASAGCEAGPFAQYCDGPIREDGSWDRCFNSQPQATFGGSGQVTGIIPSVGRCYPIDPAAFPPTPIGQPQYHIYP